MSQEFKTVEFPSAVAFLDQLEVACLTLIECFEVNPVEKDSKVVAATESLELMDNLVAKN